MAALLLLRLAPVLTTTAYLTFTCAEDLYFQPYLSPPLHKASNALLPLYITLWYTRGMILIFTLYGFTWATAIASLPVADLLHVSWPCFALYMLGLIFSIGHMLWGPKAMGLLNAIKTREGSDGSVELVEEWCQMNFIRGIVMDVPAWGCFLAAFLVWGSGRYAGAGRLLYGVSQTLLCLAQKKRWTSRDILKESRDPHSSHQNILT